MSLKPKDAALIGLATGAGLAAGGIATYVASKWAEAGFHKIKNALKKKEKKEDDTE